MAAAPARPRPSAAAPRDRYSHGPRRAAAGRRLTIGRGHGAFGGDWFRRWPGAEHRGREGCVSNTLSRVDRCDHQSERDARDRRRRSMCRARRRVCLSAECKPAGSRRGAAGDVSGHAADHPVSTIIPPVARSQDPPTLRDARAPRTPRPRRSAAPTARARTQRDPSPRSRTAAARVTARRRAQ